MKHCGKCGKSKPLSEFYKDKSKSDGKQSRCKVCARAYADANKQRRAEYQRQHYQANRERIAEYYQANRERIAERNRQHYQANREAKLEYKRQHYQANREREAERCRQWRQDNPETCRARGARRRARKRDATVEDFTHEELVDYWESNGINPDQCWYCDADAEHVDHFESLSKGGTHSRDNLVPACAGCNLSKNARSPWSYIEPLIGSVELIEHEDGSISIEIYRAG